MKVQISEVKVNHSVETFPLWFHGLGTGMRSHEPLMQHICAVYQAAAVALENYKQTVGTDAVVDPVLQQQVEFATHVERVLHGFVHYTQRPDVSVFEDLLVRLKTLLVRTARNSEVDSAK